MDRIPVMAFLFMGLCGAAQACTPAPESSQNQQEPADASDADAADADAADADVAAALVDGERAFALVDPFIGTGGLGFGYAALTPAAQVPNGLVKLGPDTTNGGSHPELSHFSGYHFNDRDVRGFSHLHLVGTGAVGLGNLRVLPVDQVDTEAPWQQHVAMDKASEVAEPGYYKVDLGELGVGVELTATQHGGLHRYSSESGQLTLLFDAASSVGAGTSTAVDLQIDGDTIEGSVEYSGDFATRTRPFTLYFSATLDPAPASVSAWTESGVEQGETQAQGAEGGLVLEFGGAEEVELGVGLSLVDLEQARNHRAAELDARTFAQVRQSAAERWKDKLGRVRVRGGSEQNLTIFYTALYNIWRMPTRLDGSDGRYRGTDGEVHVADGFGYYSDLSLWDTFRTLHPFLALVDPDLQRDCLNSLLAMQQATGYIPRWPAMLSYTGSMIGTPADQLFAESALKGIDGVDYERAFDALYQTATESPPQDAIFGGRIGIERYVELGYLPADEYDESVSRTLEFAWGDWALSNLAEHLGRDEADELAQRAANWEHLYDAELDVLRPRNADGSFAEISWSHSDRDGHYTEGTPWHWRFYPIWQPDRMVATYGGVEAFFELLSELFEGSGINEASYQTLLPDRRYWHGNEHDISAAYLFHFADRPKQVGRWIRLIQTKAYGAGPDGLPGNDDGGTLSAWYLFSALGFYPVAGGDQYLLGAPLFPYVEFDVDDGQTLVVEADGADLDTWAVDEVTVDGTPVDGPYLSHEQLVGGTLRFELQ